MPDYREIARNAARAAGIDADLFERQIEAESDFNPSAQSPAGARGIAQIMPTTAQGWGVDPMNPRAALNEAAKRMAGYQKQYGSYRDALVAYNAGPGRVGKPLYDETANYIKKIMGGRTDAGISTKPAAPIVSPSGALGGRQALLKRMWEGTPWERFSGRLQPEAPVVAESGDSGSMSGDVPEIDIDVPYEKSYKWLQKIGQEKFGLQNDPGDSQTTGGRHSTNSRHYSGRAIDFGDARNSREDLNAWYRWALADKDKYGFTEVLKEDWDGPNAHIHVAF